MPDGSNIEPRGADRSDHEDRAAVDLLVRLTFGVQSRLEELAAAHGLSVQQVRLLGILRDRTPTMNELAGFLRLDKSSVSGLVSRAEQRGLVSRRGDDQDGRVVRVDLTPAGQRLARLGEARLADQLSQLLAVLDGSERNQWMVLSEKLLATEDGEAS